MNSLKSLGLHSSEWGSSCGDGGFLDSGALESREVDFIKTYNPATETLLGTVVGSNANDYEQIVESAQHAFQVWRQVPAPKRGELIRRIADELRLQKDALGSLVSLEMGKSKQEGDGEVQEMIDMADFVVGQSRMLYGNTMHSERPHHRMYEQWHPLGVVGVISAFNFPVAVWAWNAFLSAVCGNTVIWKPSEKTPLCAIAVHKICNRIMRECGYKGLFNLYIPSTREGAQKLVDDPRIALVSFTGSSAVGREVGQRVAMRMGRSLLELGGNNAIILDESADLALAIPAIVFGAVGTTGQRCTSTRRLFVHQAIYSQVVNILKDAYSQVTIGDPLDKKNLMGPLIDARAVIQYQMAVEACRNQGGELLYGGKLVEGSGFFVEPTLFLAKNDFPIVQQETFAPILYIMQFEKLEQAVAMQNDVRQGLSSALFTNNLKQAETFLSSAGSDCGIANINIGTSGAEIGGAFGGEKETGGGREAGSDSWKAYMRRQTNTINWGSTLPLAQGIEFNIKTK